MFEKKRVLIQMKHTRELRKALTAASLSMDTVPSLDISGFSLDESYSPAKLPYRTPREEIGETDVGRFFTFDARPEVSTYLIRGEVENQETLDTLIKIVKDDPNGIGVFSDPLISAIAVCPENPVGDYKDVAKLLETDKLQEKGMDGSNVMVAIVDTGINMEHLRSKGVEAKLNARKSWSPIEETVFGPGRYPVDHGTMCAFDACIAAPKCTLLDIALVGRSTTQGTTEMDGFLSDAIKAYSMLLELLAEEREKPSLVVNNSWAMYHPSKDFPVGHEGNYSDNPNHPFNIVVESLDDAGADILFAAGNCGKKCPNWRCKDVTNRTIYGANSHESVLCVAGVTTRKQHLGYSSQGPGRISKNKPDICTYTHFEGSLALLGEGQKADNGTSAACPVASGVVAAIRSVHSPSDFTPAQLRNIIRKNAIDIGKRGFDYSYGFGLINPMGTVKAIST